jgi:hypothetical protein
MKSDILVRMVLPWAQFEANGRGKAKSMMRKHLQSARQRL